MDAFEKSFRFTILHETDGSRVTDNNPFDSGGFTYYGIARKRWPNWSGWRLVDTDIKSHGRPRTTEENPFLGEAVRAFYYQEFWLKPGLDKVAHHSPNVALEVFDTSVNIGSGAGAMLLQRALNLMNRRGTLWKDIKVDGAIGPVTLATLATCLQKRGERLLFRILNFGQGKHYWDLMEKAPEKYEEFIGWFERVLCEPPIPNTEKGPRTI